MSCDCFAVQVATGAFLFLADLARAISLPVQIDFVKAASYGVGTTSSGAVAITKDTALDLVGQNVIVVGSLTTVTSSMAPDINEQMAGDKAD